MAARVAHGAPIGLSVADGTNGVFGVGLPIRAPPESGRNVCVCLWPTAAMKRHFSVRSFRGKLCKTPPPHRGGGCVMKMRRKLSGKGLLKDGAA